MSSLGLRELKVMSGAMNRVARSRSARRREAEDDDDERGNSREDENAERRTLRANYRELQHTIQGVLFFL